MSNRPQPFDDNLIEDLTLALSTVAAMFSIHAVERHRLQTARDLRATQDRVRAVFDTILEGVVITTESGASIGFNASAERLFGYAIKDVLGRHVSLLSPENASAPP